MFVDGRKIAERIEKRLAEEVEGLDKPPHLAVLLVGDNGASEVYIKKKEEAAKRVGIKVTTFRFLKDVEEEEKVLDLIEELNEDEGTHGILVQLPLPNHLDTQEILNFIYPWKDVDGMGAVNISGLAVGEPYFIPASALAVLEVLKVRGIEIEGKRAVVVGRGRTAGFPIMLALLREGAAVCSLDGNVKNLAAHTKKADILVSAVGKSGLIQRSCVKKGAVVLDVGFSKKGRRIYGDVDSKVEEVASFLTPVPGGIGPITVVKLLENTLASAQQLIPQT